MRNYFSVLLLISASYLFAGAPTSEVRTQEDTDTAIAPVLVVVNQGDRNISLVDPLAGRQVATISENHTTVWAHEAAVSPQGHVAFAPIYGSSGVGRYRRTRNAGERHSEQADHRQD